MCDDLSRPFRLPREGHRRRVTCRRVPGPAPIEQVDELRALFGAHQRVASLQLERGPAACRVEPIPARQRTTRMELRAVQEHFQDVDEADAVGLLQARGPTKVGEAPDRRLT